MCWVPRVGYSCQLEHVSERRSEHAEATRTDAAPSLHFSCTLDEPWTTPATRMVT